MTSNLTATEAAGTRQAPYDGVVGHRRILDLLVEEAAGPAHAYLFVGPVGVGKGTVARRFGAAVLCPDGGRHDDATGCSVCRRARAGNHPDLVLVAPEGRASFTVDQARGAVAQASLTPVEGERRVFVLDEAGAMTDAAANALLKTLEEPSPGTMFVLVAGSEEELPPTVASRCRTIVFGRVPDEELVDALEGRGVARERAKTVARVAGGRPGLAFALLENPDAARYRAAWLSVPQRVAPTPGEAFRLADELLEAVEPLTRSVEEAVEGGSSADRRARERRRASQALLVSGLEMLASWYLDAAAAQLGAPVRNRDVPPTAFVSVRPPDAVRAAERTLDAAIALLANQRPRLVLADLFADLGAGG